MGPCVNTQYTRRLGEHPELGGSGPRGVMVYSVLHQKGVFDELGDLPQPASHQNIPMAQAVLLPPGAATGFPTAESVPLTPMPEEQVQMLVQQRDEMLLNAHMAEKAAQAAQKAAQQAAVAQRKAEKAQKKAQKAAQPKRPRGRPKGVSKSEGPAAGERREARRAVRAGVQKYMQKYMQKYSQKYREQKKAEDPAAWRTSLDNRAKQKRDQERKQAAEDPAAWRDVLDKRAKNRALRREKAKNMGRTA